MGKFEDLTGLRFGKLTVIERDEDYIYPNGKHAPKWKCICDCGKEHSVRSNYLKYREQPCCPECAKEKLSSKRMEDLSGKKFGRWTVIERDDNRRDKVFWKVRCECGTESSVEAHSLKSGNSKSCGCYASEVISKTKSKYNKYDLSGEYGKGWDSNGNEFWFDLDDYDRIKNYCWSRSRDDGDFTANSKNGDTFRTCTLYLHRFIMNVVNESLLIQVDHINHKRFDNRKCNLRVCSHTENQWNKGLKSNNTSGTAGVVWNKRKQKWMARIGINKQDIFLGYFTDKNDAIQARKEAEEKYFKQFSYDNSMKIAKEI